jgi:hypothetical protein
MISLISDTPIRIYFRKRNLRILRESSNYRYSFLILSGR